MQASRDLPRCIWSTQCPSATESCTFVSSSGAIQAVRTSNRAVHHDCIGPFVVVHLSDHNPVMVAQVDYRIRAEQSINGKETTEYIHKVSMI